MSRYRRYFAKGGSYFFTVTLADRSMTALTDHIEDLRAAFATVQMRMPFTIEAAVVLPDHLHMVWTLPAGDTGFSDRWRRIKTSFTKRTGLSAGRSASKQAKGEMGLWQRRFWEHLIRDEADF